MNDHRHDLLTFGETMLRLVPPDNLRLGQAQSLELSFGGAESNVAANLARLGRRTSWWSRLPNNPLGHQLTASLRAHGVSTDTVIYVEGERLGVYFIEYGNAPRTIQVIYDRENSAASKMTPSNISDDWLKSGRWLHLTGITPALSDTCAATVHSAMERAGSFGITVSFDVNHRSLLWPPENAARALAPLCELADLVFVARRDAATLFGAQGNTASEVAMHLQSVWGGTVVLSDGQDNCAACDGKHVTSAPSRDVQIIDRIGAGDAFASGVIDRLLDNASLEDALQFGTALAAIKLSVPGDIAFTNRAEVERLVRSQPTAVVR
ncbi:MAG: sugar kinase [Chloroflexota bacterium]